MLSKNEFEAIRFAPDFDAYRKKVRPSEICKAVFLLVAVAFVIGATAIKIDSDNHRFAAVSGAGRTALATRGH